jgi:hypothetical protein
MSAAWPGCMTSLSRWTRCMTSERERSYTLIQLTVPRVHSRAMATEDQRASAADFSRSIRGPRSTTRKAWVEVRDYTSLEIQTRRAMVEALREVVIPELVQLKVGVWVVLSADMRSRAEETAVAGDGRR